MRPCEADDDVSMHQMAALAALPSPRPCRGGLADVFASVANADDARPHHEAANASGIAGCLRFQPHAAAALDACGLDHLCKVRGHAGRGEHNDDHLLLFGVKLLMTTG